MCFLLLLLLDVVIATKMSRSRKRTSREGLPENLIGELDDICHFSCHILLSQRRIIPSLKAHGYCRVQPPSAAGRPYAENNTPGSNGTFIIHN